MSTPAAAMRGNGTLVSLLAYLSGQQQLFETEEVQERRGQQPREPAAHRRHGQQPRVGVKGLGETDQHVGAARR